MRTVRPRRFREYFETDAEDEWRYGEGLRFDWDRFFYKNRRRFNRQALVLLTLLVFGITAWTSRAGRVFLLTELAFLALLYWQALRAGQGLYLTRKLPAAGYDFQPLRVEYEIRNAAGFATGDLVIRDFFSGTLEPAVQTVRETPIRPFKLGRAAREVICDAGMGTHAWGPLSTVVSDPIGIFEVVVTDDDKAVMQVLPSPITLTGFELPESLESDRSGTNESRVKGTSSNFFGVREYVQGDPLKSINWKLSARHRQLIVNEFETYVPTDLTVSLDLDGKNHIGRIGDSSWKTAKDLAVAIVQNYSAGASRFQFVSQGRHLDFGQGASQLLAITRAISRLEPVRPGTEPPLLEQWAEAIPFGSSLIHVMPVYQNDRDRLLRAFAYLAGKSVRCTVILVEARSYLVDLPIELTTGILEIDRRADELRDRLVAELSVLGIPAFCVRRGDDLSRALAKAVAP